MKSGADKAAEIGDCRPVDSLGDKIIPHLVDYKMVESTRRSLKALLLAGSFSGDLLTWPTADKLSECGPVQNAWLMNWISHEDNLAEVTEVVQQIVNIWVRQNRQNPNSTWPRVTACLLRYDEESGEHRYSEWVGKVREYIEISMKAETRITACTEQAFDRIFIGFDCSDQVFNSIAAKQYPGGIGFFMKYLSNLNDFGFIIMMLTLEQYYKWMPLLRTIRHTMVPVVTQRPIHPHIPDTVLYQVLIFRSNSGLNANKSVSVGSGEKHHKCINALNYMPCHFDERIPESERSLLYPALPDGYFAAVIGNRTYKNPTRLNILSYGSFGLNLQIYCQKEGHQCLFISESKIPASYKASLEKANLSFVSYNYFDFTHIYLCRFPLEDLTSCKCAVTAQWQPCFVQVLFLF